MNDQKQSVEMEKPIDHVDRQITSNTFTDERNPTMFALQKTEFVRIFLVKESHCDKGMYVLEAFDDDCFNEEINLDEIYEEFCDLVEYFFGEGCYFIIDDASTVDDDGNILLNDTAITGEELHFIIPPISESIDTDVDLDGAIYGVIVDTDDSEYFWVVAQPTRTEYRG